MMKYDCIPPKKRLDRCLCCGKKGLTWYDGASGYIDDFDTVYEVVEYWRCDDCNTCYELVVGNKEES